MPEKPYKAPEVTSEMKMRYHVDAERRYRTMSEDKLQKEYKQLILKKTPWEWFKERVASFVNMVKIAALSIFIGRQETARRIQFGNREEEFEKLKNEVQRDAKITVLEEKLETLQRMKEDKSKESSDVEKKESDRNGKAKDGQEPENDQEQDNAQDDTTKDSGAEASLPQHENTKSVSIFAEQIENASDKYKEGLRKYLETQMGINGAFINIENVIDKENSFLRISFDAIALPENSELLKGMTIDKKGNSLEQTKTASEITKAVLYYTTEIYRDSKNCNRIIGTVPTHAMCTEMVHSFIDKALKDQENGDINCSYQESLFEHKIDFEKTGNTFRINLDGKELDFQEGWSTKNLADQIRDTMLNKEFGDFTADAEYFLAENLHQITRTEVEPAYYIKYSSLELEDKFNKTLNDILRDGSETTRNLSFHTHCIQITINAHEICSVSINGDSVYRDIDGKQDIGQIAEHIADNLGSKLALDDMYRYDESLKKLEDVIEFSNTDMHTREEVSDFEQTMEYDDYNDELEQ